MNVEQTRNKIRIEVALPISLQQAWSLLSEREHVVHWWGNHVNLDARLGGEFIEKWSNGNREVVTAGKVTRCMPPSSLEMTWADDDWRGDTHVSFELSAEGDHARLVLEHVGWDVHAGDVRENLVDAHAKGWSQHLRALRDYASEAK